uniref:C2H2-type domain-containing protein n=1 Tax=Glossina brevipalpis TaxID=37001 RepID=A0A1A9X1U3_9MUSC
MSTQLEFIMQLYMMNLLQQQQQQQHQRQQQQQQPEQQQIQQHQQQLLVPTSLKPKDLKSCPQSLLTQPPAQTLPAHQQQPLLSSIITRTQKRKNSQNTNCSSSRSCSPNSNLSPISTSTTMLTTPPSPCLAPSSAANVNPSIATTNFTNTINNNSSAAIQQMLFNSLPPLTQLMLMQQQQSQTQPGLTSTNSLLLTPTTPNSSCPDTNKSLLPLPVLNMDDFLSNNLLLNGCSAATLPSSVPFANSAITSGLYFPNAFNSVINNPFIGSQNFLHSSTVISTPTTEKVLLREGSNTNIKQMPAQSDISAVGDDVGDNDVSLVITSVSDSELQKRITSVENQSLPGLYNSSLVNTSETDATTNGGNNTSSDCASKLLLSPAIKALENISDSMDHNEQMSFTTPSKSSLNVISPHQPNSKADDENSNATPVTLKNIILTPPSSEQLSSSAATVNAFESSTSNLSINPQTSTPLLTCQLNANANTTSSSSSSSTGVDSFLTEENLKHLRKYSSYLECENTLCRQENLREHFHCFEEPCKGKILSKKDDIIRHLKWHKKRKESLLLGFARFSSSDDCEPTYGSDCSYNWKQTHYHCVYEDCPKVYVSTSDVQMHANFHRKNSEIVQEGFRRYRAHENCKIEDCPFFGKKISHYHCCREGCNHTFKNKADMDKHKTYHLKDSQLIQDGFKKILKTEPCPFEDCKFSGISNHIHCVRDNCNFILHSSTQMVSHKRKHERQEGEPALKTPMDSNEEESPKPSSVPVLSQVNATSNTSTPLSSLSAEHFLARKRGRPPKKIQLPAESVSDTKRIKLETSVENINNQITMPSSSAIPALAGFMPNFNLPLPSTTTISDTNQPNFQLTHLMALFQLQNPLFYQNLYPGGLNAVNMANLLGAAAATASSGTNIQLPVTNPTNSPNSINNIKQEFNEKE